MKVLFVCLGNICRSPLAEGILQYKADKLGLNYSIDSAGTSNWHVGEPPDNRGISVAYSHGVDISGQRARQFKTSDFENFDLIIAMDKSNYSNILNLAENKEQRNKVKLYMNIAYTGKNIDVPDPYYDNSFEEVFQILDQATDKIIDYINNIPS